MSEPTVYPVAFAFKCQEGTKIYSITNCKQEYLLVRFSAQLLFTFLQQGCVICTSSQNVLYTALN